METNATMLIKLDPDEKFLALKLAAEMAASGKTEFEIKRAVEAYLKAVEQINSLRTQPGRSCG